MSIMAGNDLRVTAVMLLGGDITVENVYNVHVDSIASGTDFDAMTDLAAWLDNAYDQLSGGLNSDLASLEVRGFNVSADEPLPTVPWPSWAGGSDAGDILASGVSLLVLFRTALSRVIGRKFIGGYSKTAMAAGLWTSTTLGQAVDYAAEIITPPVMTEFGGSMHYGVLAHSGFVEDVTSLAVQAVPAYQRRRRLGRGS